MKGTHSDKENNAVGLLLFLLTTLLLLGGGGGALAFDTTRASSTIGRGEGKVDVPLGIETDDK